MPGFIAMGQTKTGWHSCSADTALGALRNFNRDWGHDPRYIFTVSEKNNAISRKAKAIQQHWNEKKRKR